MNKRTVLFSLLLMGFAFLFLVRQERLAADYASDLRSQIRQAQSRSGASYFHDMGIIARKADESELTDLTTEIIKTHLLKKMDEYVQGEIKAVNELYPTDGLKASQRLQTLNKYQRFYEPSEDFLTTTGGQAIQSDMIRFRDEAGKSLEKQCSSESITKGIQAILKSGLFVTKTPEEIRTLQSLPPRIECCLSFKPELYFQDKEIFKSTYDEGTVKREVRLKLTSNRRDYSVAKWTGEWIHHFDGRDGTGEGIAQAFLEYSRGAETAKLSIAASRVTSVGRINFPENLMGQERTLEIQGNALAPLALFSSGMPVSMTGCRPAKK